MVGGREGGRREGGREGGGREGGKEGGRRERGRDGGRDGGRSGWKDRGRDGGKKRGREGRKILITSLLASTHHCVSEVHSFRNSIFSPVSCRPRQEPHCLQDYLYTLGINVVCSVVCNEASLVYCRRAQGSMLKFLPRKARPPGMAWYVGSEVCTDSVMWVCTCLYDVYLLWYSLQKRVIRMKTGS